MLPHDRLRREQHEGVLDEPPHVVARLVLGPFERVGAQIEQPGRRSGTIGCAQTSKPCAFCSINTAFHCS